ncbi:hypothetical protein BN1708_020515, partial [Verticillium longisporum]
GALHLRRLGRRPLRLLAPQGQKGLYPAEPRRGPWRRHRPRRHRDPVIRPRDPRQPKHLVQAAVCARRLPGCGCLRAQRPRETCHLPVC